MSVSDSGWQPEVTSKMCLDKNPESRDVGRIEPNFQDKWFLERFTSSWGIFHIFSSMQNCRCIHEIFFFLSWIWEMGNCSIFKESRKRKFRKVPPLSSIFRHFFYLIFLKSSKGQWTSRRKNHHLLFEQEVEWPLTAEKRRANLRIRKLAGQSLTLALTKPHPIKLGVFDSQYYTIIILY